MEEQNRLDSWDSFTLGQYLKAEDLRDNKEPYVCVRVELEEVKRKDGDIQQILVLTLQKNGVDVKFSVNKTNAKFLSQAIGKPRDLIGRTVFFEKIKVRDPSTDKIVDSLLINQIG